MFRTRAWYRSCVIESGMPTPGSLDREFAEELGVTRRTWERYAAGHHTPSLTWGTSPGIVQHMGWRYPRTLEVFQSPLWRALNPTVPLGDSMNELLLQLHPTVHEQFLSESRGGSVVADWPAIREAVWDYPHEPLAMDYLAAYLILFRELRRMHYVAEAEQAQTWVLAALSELRTSGIFSGFLNEMEDFVMKHFLGKP